MPQGGSYVKLFDIGGCLREIYLRSTTHSRLLSTITPARWWLQAGTPLMFLEMDPSAYWAEGESDASEIRYHEQRITISSADYKLGGKYSRLIVLTDKSTITKPPASQTSPARTLSWDGIRESRPKHRNMSRELRASLLRLNAHHEVLRLILSAFQAGSIASSTTSMGGQHFQTYLNLATRIVSKSRRPYSGVDPPTSPLDLIARVLPLLWPGSMSSLESELERANVRLNIARKVRSIVIMEQNNSFKVNQAGIVGVEVSGNTQVNSQTQGHNDALPASTDWDVLLDEIRKLTEHLKDQAATPEDFVALEELSAARFAAEKKEGHSVVHRLGRVGRWALDGARQIGATIVAEVIMKSAGLK